MNVQQTYNVAVRPVCLYDTQGNVSCDKAIWKNCETAPVQACTKAFTTCTEIKCQDKNKLLFARFEDEKNTWR